MKNTTNVVLWGTFRCTTFASGFKSKKKNYTRKLNDMEKITTRTCENCQMDMRMYMRMCMRVAPVPEFLLFD